MWDGVGAWIKRTVRQDIVDHPMQKTILTDSGYIRWPNEAAEHLKKCLDTEAYVDSHMKATINEVVVMYTATTKIHRPKPEHTYESITGIQKTFMFMPIRESVVLERPYACWCWPCMHAYGPREGSMDSAHRCLDCESIIICWKETSVARADAAGIANAKARTLQQARQLAAQLEKEAADEQCPHLDCRVSHLLVLWLAALHSCLLYISTHISSRHLWPWPIDCLHTCSVSGRTEVKMNRIAIGLVEL